MATEEHKLLVAVNVSVDGSQKMAGFEVSINGRFWVSTEAAVATTTSGRLGSINLSDVGFVAAEQKQFTFGTCSVDHLSPPTIAPSTRAVNIVISFEDALKLNLAISEGVRALNKNNRSTREGRDAALNLTVHLNKRRITVNPGKVKRQNPRTGTGSEEEGFQSGHVGEPEGDDLRAGCVSGWAGTGPAGRGSYRLRPASCGFVRFRSPLAIR